MGSVATASVPAFTGIYLGVDRFWVTDGAGEVRMVPAACFRDLRGEVSVGEDALHARVFWPERTLIRPMKLLGEAEALATYWDDLPRQTIVRKIAAAVHAKEAHGRPSCVVVPAFLEEELEAIGSDLPFHLIDSLSLTAAFAAITRSRRALVMDLQPGWLSIALVVSSEDAGMKVNVSHRWVLEGAQLAWTAAELVQLARYCAQEAGVELRSLDGGLIIGTTDATTLTEWTEQERARLLTPADLVRGAAVLMFGAVRVHLGPRRPLTGFISQRRSQAVERLSQRLKRSHNAEEAALYRKCEMLLELIGSLRSSQYEQWSLVRLLDDANVGRVPLIALKHGLMRAIVGGPVQCRTVALVSPFSFGKSTLVNALVGAELLATDFRAETAQSVRIVPAERHAVLVERTETFSRHEASSTAELAAILKDLTGVRSGGTGEVQGIHVGLPLPERLRWCELVDTPGFFSRYGSHDEGADLAWKTADLLVVVNDPAKLGDAYFGEKIRQFQQAGKPALYVVTKRDQVQGREALLTAELREAIGNPDAPVLHVSGYHGLNGRLWAHGQKSLEEVRWDRDLFVMDGTTLLRGPSLQQHHASAMVEFSNMAALERQINWMAGGVTG